MEVLEPSTSLRGIDWSGPMVVSDRKEAMLCWLVKAAGGCNGRLAVEAIFGERKPDDRSQEAKYGIERGSLDHSKSIS